MVEIVRYTFWAAYTSRTLQTLDTNQLTCMKTQAPMARSVATAANYPALNDIPTMRDLKEIQISKSRA